MASGKIIVPDLSIAPREGGYARGQEGYEQILQAALTLLVEHGYRALSFRKVADASGMKVGHVSYYFPTKEDLVRTLLDAVISSYEGEFMAIMHEEGTTPEQRLVAISSLILRDITSKKTTRTFPELWALSNHDPFVADRVNELYARARAAIIEIIGEINPALSAEQREVLGVFISASMEGQTVFAGHGKPFVHRMGWIEKISAKSFLYLVREMRPADFD